MGQTHANNSSANWVFGHFVGLALEGLKEQSNGTTWLILQMPIVWRGRAGRKNFKKLEGIIAIF